MKVTVDGTVYDYDDEKLAFRDALEIQQRTGMTMRQWQQGLNDMAPDAVGALVYMLKKQAGEQVDWDTFDFDMGTLEFEDTPEVPTEAETS